MEETRPMELFIDLFYVGIIAINAQTVARTPDSFQLHIFALTFMWFIVRSFLKVVHHGGYGPTYATWCQHLTQMMSCNE